MFIPEPGVLVPASEFLVPAPGILVPSLGILVPASEILCLHQERRDRTSIAAPITTRIHPRVTSIAASASVTATIP